jgi:hypothetical protein
MAASGQLPVMQAARMAYRDVFRALSAMPGLVLIALLVTLAFALVQILFFTGVFETPVVGALTSFLFGAAQSFFLTPYLIAVHRFILIDEVTSHYALDPQAPRFMRFFAWTVALSALAGVATLIHEILILIGLGQFLAVTVLIVLMVVVVFIGMRLTILFPAIAVDAPGATAENAFADTKGHAWRIFLIGIVVILPFIVVAVVAALATVPFALSDPNAANAPPSPLFLIVTAVVAGVIGLPLFVAIASRIFQALADRVLGRSGA